MLSVSIVLIAIVGTINIANYISTNQALDARLSLIADNGGTFPDMTPGDFGKKLEPKSDPVFYSDDRTGRYSGICGYRKNCFHLSRESGGIRSGAVGKRKEKRLFR